MLWLWILLGIAAFLVLINVLSITLSVYADSDTSYVDVRYGPLRFRIYPEKEKKPKRKKRGKAKKKSETQKEPENSELSDNGEDNDSASDSSVKETVKPENPKKGKQKSKSKKQKKESGLLDDLKYYLDLLEGVPSLVGKLIKRIRFEKVYVYIEEGSEDACETALSYGKLNAAVWTVYGLLCGIFTVKLKSVDIVPVFGEDIFKYRIKALIKLRIYHIIIIALRVLLKIFMKKNKKER